VLAIADTLVYFQSSLRVVGKPRRANASAPAARSVVSGAGARSAADAADGAGKPLHPAVYSFLLQGATGGGGGGVGDPRPCPVAWLPADRWAAAAELGLITIAVLGEPVEGGHAGVDGFGAEVETAEGAFEAEEGVAGELP
jgi:hypothetical protein